MLAIGVSFLICDKCGTQGTFCDILGTLCDIFGTLCDVLDTALRGGVMFLRSWPAENEQ